MVSGRKSGSLSLMDLVELRCGEFSVRGVLGVNAGERPAWRVWLIRAHIILF